MNNYVKLIFAKYKFLILFFIVFSGLVVMAPVVFGINYPDEGWRVDKRNVKAISAVGTTTKLLLKNVSSAVSYFVPTKTAAELAAFLKVRPTNLEMGSCGDRFCNFDFGENSDTCPADCGIHPDRMFTWQFEGTYDPWNQKTVGGICGDGVCNPAAEDATSCPYDCTTGCCAVKGNWDIPNCNLYASYKPSDGYITGINECEKNPGCTTVSNKGYRSFIDDYYYQICGFNQNYPCENYNNFVGSSSFDYTEYIAACEADPSCTWNTDRDIYKCVTTNFYCQKYCDFASGGLTCTETSCVSDPKCEWDSERETCVGKTKACWDNKDYASCLTNSNCAWIGQKDSPHCYNYCGDGINNNFYETCQTCPIEKHQTSPYINDVTFAPQCGDGHCTAVSPAYENIYNCPSDCADYSNGKIVSTYGCGDGFCNNNERKGQAGYCYVDCGDIGEGVCIPFNDACPSLTAEEKTFTFFGCNTSFLNSYNLDFKRDECSYAKNRNECNRFGCYWDVINILEPCGDGNCDPGTEDCNNCPGDCGYCPRIGFCEGNNLECSKYISYPTCQSNGCRWVEF